MISILVPTRNRPEKVASVVRGALERAARPAGVEFLFYLDPDDRVSEPAIRDAAQGSAARIVRGPRVSDQSYWNRLADEAGGDVLFLGADDLSFRSEAWDDAIRTGIDRVARSGIGMVWGDDLDLGGRLATHPFVTRRWKEVVGFFVPPYFERCFVDLWIHELAILTGLGRYVPEAVIEHLHVELGKAGSDDLYQEIRNRPFSHREYARRAPERLEQARSLLSEAGLDRGPDEEALARAKDDARTGGGGKWFVWP